MKHPLQYLAGLLLTIPAFAAVGADLTRALHSIELDPAACYRVRDLQLTRGDARFFFNDGFLTFSKPIGSGPVAAVFTTNVDQGDGEVLLLPPIREERKALAAHTNSPNLDEHIHQALLFFADNTAAQLMEQIEANPWIKRDAGEGAALAEHWNNFLRTIVPGFETHLLLDMLAPAGGNTGFFAALAQGSKIGSFDFVFEPRSTEPVRIGEIDLNRDDSAFNTWASYTPKSLAGKAPEPEFRADDYVLDSTIDTQLMMRVNATFTVRDVTKSLRALPFGLSKRMRVLSVEVDGEPAEISETEGTRFPSEDATDRLLVIIPANALDPGRPHKVNVKLEGNVIATAGERIYFVGSRGRWYPHRSGETATFTLKFHYPKSLDLVAPGDPVSSSIEGDERFLERRVSSPIPLAGFNLGSFDRSTSRRGDITVEVCANRDSHLDLSSLMVPTPGLNPRDRRIGSDTDMEAQRATDPSARREALAEEVADVMDFYTKHFGPPALSRLEVTPIPGRFGQGFGGLIYLSTIAYMTPGGKIAADMNPQTRIFFAHLLQAHEAAHQWWGNLVFTAGYHDEWISEALANYSAMLYIEKRLGGKAVQTLLESYKRALLEKNPAGQEIESAGPVTQGKRLALPGRQDVWVPIIYGKGTWIMHMLHARLGDEGFWKMLAALRARYEHKTITTDQFRELCAEFVPAGQPDRKLEVFFDQWVWSTGIPTLRFAGTLKGKAPALRASGTLEQKDVPEDFAADFPIEIQGHGKPIVKWVRSSSDATSFAADAPAATSLQLDPANWFLKR